MSHTPEPWWLDEDGHRIEANPTGRDGGRREIAACFSTWADAKANARRIVACVNACAGIATEGLERGTPIIAANQLLAALGDEYKKQRDELLAALKEYIAAADSSMCADDESDDVAKMLRFGDADKAARAAITKAEAA